MFNTLRAASDQRDEARRRVHSQRCARAIMACPPPRVSCLRPAPSRLPIRHHLRKRPRLTIAVHLNGGMPSPMRRRESEMPPALVDTMTCRRNQQRLTQTRRQSAGLPAYFKSRHHTISQPAPQESLPPIQQNIGTRQLFFAFSQRRQVSGDQR